MSLFSDPYASYVVAAYAASAIILVAVVLTTVRANARARAALEKLEKERGR